MAEDTLADITTLLGYFVRRAKQGDALVEKHRAEMLGFVTSLIAGQILPHPRVHQALGPAIAFLTSFIEKFPKNREEALRHFTNLLGSEPVSTAELTTILPSLELFLATQQDEKVMTSVLRILLQTPRRFTPQTGTSLFWLFFRPPDSKLKNHSQWYEASLTLCISLLEEPNSVETLLPVLFAISGLL